MEIFLDTANIRDIEYYNDIYEITGVTSNPTIISREKSPFFPTLCKIRKIIGDEKQLHVQVTGKTSEEMIKEAEAVVKNLGKGTYIKVPADETGIKTISLLKKEGYNVTATAIYSVQQAFLASSADADYVAPYINRMFNLNMDGTKAVSDIVKLFSVHERKTKILAASFKNAYQIADVLLAGAHAVTASPELYTVMVKNSLIDGAIEQFDKDWTALYGNKKIYEF